MHRVTAQLLKKPFADQKSEEWLNKRKQMLTASDAAAALKPNIKDLLLRKCGHREFHGNTATRHGEFYEDEARDVYEKTYSTKVYEFGLCEHPEHQWLGGSPDGVTIDGILLEIKCPYSRIPTDSVPPQYYPQLQVCMEVLDLEMAHFVEYIPECHGNYVFQMIRVPRDREWFKSNLPKLKQSWEQIRICQEDNSQLPDSRVKKGYLFID